MIQFVHYRMNKALLLLVTVVFFTTITARSQSVYKTPSGKKYHLASCRMVENVSEKLTVKQALELYLEPCKICKPKHETVQASALISKAVNGESVTTQCKGITKAGSRCKHMTRIGNGYCFQHQPKTE